MDSIRAYLLGVVAAAIICGIVTRLMGEKGTQGAMAKLICGLFLAFTVIRPVVDLNIGSITDFAADFSQAGADAAALGQSMTRDALAASIKQRSETYILDKAKELDVTLQVEVTLSNEDIPTATAVRLKGNVSPYVKGKLQSIIQQDLGINKEHQTWI